MIIERAPLPIVEVQGSAHMVSHVNSAFCRLLGKSRTDLVGKSFADIVHGGNQCMPILDRVYQTGEAATLAQEDESDPASTVWLYAMWPALDANEQPVGVIIQLAKAADFRKDTTAINEALLISGLRQHELKDAAEKLTEQLQAEITARRQGDEARAILATIVESSEDAIISKDLNGTIATWNRGAERLFGYSAEEAIGQPITMLFPPDKLDEEAAILAGIRSGKPVKPYETVRCRKDGTLVDVALSVSPILDARGEIVGVAKIVRDITERKRAADRILRSEENYRLLVESATGFAIIRLQLDGTVSSWNVGAERIFGYRDAEILGAHFSIFFTPEDLTAGRPGRELRAASHLEKGDDDNWLVRMDGSRFWASGATTALRDEAGNLHGYAKIVRDMTGQRAANEQLRAIEARKSAILDGALDGIITMDHEGKVVDFNPAAEAMFGIARAEIVGQRMAERIIPERLRESHYRGLAHYLASGEGPMLKKRIEVPALHADGHEFMIELSINRIAGVEPAMFTATLRDITERQRAEVALRESELHFRALADNIPQLSWMTDATGAIFWYNQRWFDFTGTTLAQMEGWGWQAVNHPDHLPRILERWQASLAAGTNFEDTFPLRGADGEYRWFLTRAVPIRDESGNVQRWFGTNTDVTAQRDAADALALAKEQVEAVSRAKDDFLAALSHELRTPLTPVLMMAADLAGDPAVPIEVRDQLAMMRRNIELEARLIDDLLDLTRISRGKLRLDFARTDMQEQVKNVVEMLEHDAR
ncbi:MAG: PAS domain S-box protein, partial [Verrucomicrobiota bacterium]|nr:PAS domain S-box protein [Verrucomicrobiota bacterium]